MTNIEANDSLKIDPILRFPEVLAFTGARSRQTIYNWMEKGLFPSSIELGPNSIGWLKSECEAWKKQRMEQRQALQQ
jgi:prophage regulatory protein